MKSKISSIFIFIFLVFSLVGCAGEVGPQGEQGIQGIQGEQGQPGKDGTDGKDGVDGQDGVNGKDGTSLLTGNGEPTNVIGIVGDSYIDLDTWSFYIKTTNGWVISGNIKGEKGESASPDHNGTEGLEFYPINDTECAVAVGNAKLLKEIVIPSKYKHYTVTTIYGNTIADSGFSYCGNLEKITIPDSVTSIGPAAFYNCTSLTSIIIPNSVTSIGPAAFYNCTSLTSIIIPNSIKTIGYSAFENCDSLSNIEFEDNINLENIERSVFSGCDSLKSIELPNSVKTIGYYAFSSCESLTSIMFSEDSKLENISEYAFSYCSKLTNIELPNLLKTIEGRAFSDCKSLSKIFIPNNVINLESSSFQNCNLVVYAQSSADECEWSEDFNTYSSNLTYYGVKHEEIIEENDIQYLINGEYVLLTKYLSSETKAKIPSSININGKSYDITTIGLYAFSGCDILEEVIIPEGVTTIEEGVFDSCSNLIDVQLPNTLESIGSSAFAYCSKLEEIIIPEGVIEIDEVVFKKCTSLSKVLLPNTLECIDYYSFAYCENLTTVIIPSSVKKIGNHSFAYCKNLTNIVIPSSVEVIDSYAFEQNYKLNIYCEIESQPDGWANSSLGWNSSWNPDNRPVYWAGQWEYDADGNPVPLS